MRDDEPNKGRERKKGASAFINHVVRCAGAGGCCWSGVREKHCWLAGGWRLLLEWCERKILLAGAGAKQQNRVIGATLVVVVHQN